MEQIQGRRDKHKGEFQRLGNAGYNTGGNARNHQRLHLGLFLWRGCPVNGQRRCRKTEHHHGHLALSQEHGKRLKFRDIHLINKLQENVQAALHPFIDTADGSGTENAVKHMVKPGGNQQALQEAVSEYPCQPGSGYQPAHAVNGHGYR